jgi:hypothetical protein
METISYAIKFWSKVGGRWVLAEAFKNTHRAQKYIRKKHWCILTCSYDGMRHPLCAVLCAVGL